MTKEDQMKLMRFELDEARWVHEEVMRPRLYRWVDSAIINIVEHKKYGAIGRVFHFLIEFFYFNKFLRMRIKRSTDQSLLGGKGFRQGTQKFRLDAIRSSVLVRGKEVATKKFPISIISK